MLLWITIAVAVIGLIGCFILRGNYAHEGLNTFFMVLAVGGIMAGIIMGVVLIMNYSGVEGDIAEYQQHYESLVYQAETGAYNTEVGVGKYEFVKEVTEWNCDLARYKIMQHNFWVGIFIPDIYDQFSFISMTFLDEVEKHPPETPEDSVKPFVTPQVIG